MKRTFFFLILLACIQFLSAQSFYVEGSWTKLGTTYEFPFQLQLHHSDNEVEGVFIWQLQNSDNNNFISQLYYQDKLGLSAKEYVRGSYDASTGKYSIQGYKKEDPNNIISLDKYELYLESDGLMHGKTASHGEWNGRINGHVAHQSL